MYECRILFPGHGRRAIRREIEEGRDDLTQRNRRDGGCLRPVARPGRGRS
ncbi:MAG: hypothetical protein MUC54_07095 [Chloroflexi bacterium]|jgi:hypothetical protein|nr:hypothetical protein [Chloroflexota bacterium]